MWLLNPYWYTAQYSAAVSNYLDQVIAADVEAGNLLGLEDGTKTAYATFINNLIVDGYLGVSGGTISQASSVMKASPIMAGARTLAGASVPLVGPAVTLLGTAGGWTYNRKTGARGNGTNNAFDSNRAGNQGLQDSAHVAFHIGALGAGASFFDNATTSTPRITFYDTNSSGRGQINSSTSLFGLGIPTGGFAGFNRSASNAWVNRVNGSTSSTKTTNSSATTSGTIVFQARRNVTTGVLEFLRTDAITFYSIGESLDLALLDARVSALISAFAAAIP